jgi:hypothetical protein
LVGIVVAVLALDTLSRFIPQTPVVNAAMTTLFGVLFLGVASLVGIMSAYAGQRLSMPLQDRSANTTEREFGKICAILSGNSGNQCNAIFRYADDTPATGGTRHGARVSQ